MYYLFIVKVPNDKQRTNFISFNSGTYKLSAFSKSFS